VTGIFTKTYTDHAACRTAAANHRWLSNLGLRLPALLAERSHELSFAFVDGRQAEPRDLVPLAEYLGQTHAIAYEAQLHRARLDSPYTASCGHRIPDFIAPRLDVIEKRLRSGVVPEPRLNLTEVRCVMQRFVSEPVAFYKDTNPRNILITANGPVMVDFDDLTLAPFGYDLAKLIVTLMMTYGHLSEISSALAAYNATVANITSVSWEDLMTWSKIHHILTSPYFGSNGYTHIWSQLRFS
jgi:hypothetical protein